ncbi:phosphodiesterase [Paucilactobacillus hokkaidonensis]|nr:phosphodiesterase [Paucilactobacillus hokkaidonensis]
MQNVEFRRQKQFNWDALRGWALGLFNGFTDYSDSLDAKMSYFDKQFDDQMSAATDGDKNLSEIVDARDSRKYGDFATIGKRLDKIENLGINLAADSVISGEVSDDDKVTLDAIKKALDPAKFNLLFFTDAHYGKWGSNPERANNTSINHLANALYLDDSVDVIVAGGDNIDGWTDSLVGLLNEHSEFARKLLFGGGNRADRFTLKGNHDDGSGRILQYIEGDYDYIKWRDGALGYSAAIPTVISDDQLKQLYHTGDLLFNEHRVADSLYFYKDYPDKKVRLIGLDSNDGPEVLDDKGLPKYFAIKHMGYQQAQIDWLANTALTGVPDDYVVMVVGHIPAAAVGSDQNNQTLINQILNAFQSGQAIHALSTDVDWPVDVSANYSAQGSRTVVAYVNGHLHQEFLTQNLGFTSVSVTSSINDGRDGTPYDGKTNIDGWDVISIDRDNAKINITGFGRAKNRSAQYGIAGGASK